MSAILRTKEKFGAHYVIDVLLGSKQKKILDYQHDTLSVYGIGTEYSKTDWLNITNLLIAEKYILKSEDYNVLSLTEFAKIALSQRKKIFLPFTPTGKTGKPDSNLLTNLQKKSKVQFSDKEVKLQEALKTLRKKLAEEYNVPPYIIFGDKTLEQLVYEKPLSDFELENVYGLAAKKIERYGEQIIKVIEENI